MMNNLPFLLVVLSSVKFLPQIASDKRRTELNTFHLKPIFSFGKLVKMKNLSNGFCLKSCMSSIKALWIVLSETTNILRKLHES